MVTAQCTLQKAVPLWEWFFRSAHQKTQTDLTNVNIIDPWRRCGKICKRLGDIAAACLNFPK